MPGSNMFKSFSRNPFLQPRSRTFEFLVNLYFFIYERKKKINSQQNTIEDFQHQFQHGKMFYYSSVHIKSLMGQYSFKLIDEYQTQDERYPTLTQSILVFKKQENYLTQIILFG